MRRQAAQMEAQCRKVQRQIAYHLGQITMEERSIGLTDFSDFTQRLQNACFIVGSHNCHQGRPLGERVGQF